MKHLITSLVLAFLLSTNSTEARDYYVAKTGNDSNSGNFGSPFKTIQKAVNTMSENDVCVVRTGTYRETVTVNKNNITIKAYQNEAVVVSGADLVKGWTVHSGNIYKANLSGVQPEFTQVFFNGTHQQIARYPDNVSGDMLSIADNAGYASCTVSRGGRVEFANNIPGGANKWRGGYFRAISGKTWTNPMGKITGSSGKIINCTPISKDWQDGYVKLLGGGKGYILHLKALSRAGEWYYEKAQNKLYYWKPGGGKPGDNQVEAQKREYAFKINNRRNVKLFKINIKSATIEMKESNGCTIERCSFKYQKGWFTRSGYNADFRQLGGVYVKGSNNKFIGCYFYGGWGTLLNIESGNNNSVTNSIFENNGWMGMFTSCILNSSYNLKVNRCTFGSTGRFHIRTDAKTEIMNNDFYDCMKMGQDAGSIEITNGGKWGIPVDMGGAQIAYNKFHDMNTLKSFIDDKNFVVALYLEGAKNYTVHHNLVYNIKTIKGQGEFVYLGPRKSHINKCYYYNNTVWNVNKLIGVWNRDGEGRITDTKFINNIFDSRTTSDFGNPSLESGILRRSNIVSNNSDRIFGNNYELKNGSPAVNSGEVISGITNGHKGAAPDAGCYEKGAAKWTCGATIGRNAFRDANLRSAEVITYVQDIDAAAKTSAAIEVFPNPANSFVKVKVTDNTKSKVNIKLFNSAGSCIFTQQIQTNAVEVIDISSYPKGVYYLKSGYASKALVVQ